MILRDAIVSSERHRLGVVDAAPLDPRPDPLRPELTVSEVCTWLMGEGDVARRACAVYVHPSALVAIEAEHAGLQAAIGDATLDVQGDPALSSGGCRVESDLGIIDAAFDVQLQALIEMLRAAHMHRVIL